ncbi:unnamed protein product [Pedinophyceae sp. YPF-701]|nr:unnamed protein product [Pedinophyceae sp. YPF-701]
MDAWKSVKPYVNGGLAGMGATCCIQPIDMVKVRLQLGATGGPFKVASDIIKQDGFGSLYKGLNAGLVRQMTYTTARLGLFNKFNDGLKEMNKDTGKVPLWQNAVAGLAAGGLGAVVGTPADLTLIRMQSDATLPAAERRNYTGVMNAFVRITKEEGFMGLFAGCGPTVVRAMALNMGMLASNEAAKDLLASTAGMDKGTPSNTFTAAFISGFFASFFSLPFDFVKTRVQKMKKGPDGKYPYKGPMDCAMQTLKNEGPLTFYTGFPTFYVRIAPHVTLTLVFMEAIKKFQAEYGL